MCKEILMFASIEIEKKKSSIAIKLLSFLKDVDIGKISI